jgi:hypothetical protein
MKDSSGARGLSQRSRAVRTVAQDRHLRIRRHAETAQHAVQLRVLLVCLTGHATEQDQLFIVIVDLRRYHLERPALVAMRGPAPDRLMPWKVSTKREELGRKPPGRAIRQRGSNVEWGSAQPPRATSWICFVPSAQLNSIVTRHSIPAPWSSARQR